MSNNLSDVWAEVQNLLAQNINVIPVRDRDEVYNGKLFQAKTPYKKWEQYQYERIDQAVLFDQMTRFDTTAIAMVCGAISGNLEVIDFDVKYNPGIDARVMTGLQEFYPDLFEKLKSHRTRSGGTHLVYKIKDHEVPPNTHLANRPKTQDEIDSNPKSKKKYVTFIETRGTGGLATAPPSMGYTVIKDIPIQEITWEERCSIIEFCKAFNEYFPDEKPYTPPKTEQSYYDENPFEHYNRTADPVELFTEFGWAYVKKHGNYIWFTRPGGKRGEVHAGFNLNNFTYRVWGTKADLDSDRSYTPSTILAHYRFNNDKSATYAYLVERGFGRIKPHMERTMARNRAIQGKPMPTNASQHAVQQYTAHVEQIKTAHPHGVYWEPDPDEQNKITISRLRFKDVATGLGFRFYDGEIVHVCDRVIYRRDLRFFYDTMREYIKEDDPDLYEEIYNATQAFIEKHGKFESSQLDFLDESLILKDTATTCCKLYLNGYVLITQNNYELFSYDTLSEKLIWHEKIQQRNFICEPVDSSALDTVSPLDSNDFDGKLYTSFLRLACDLDNNRNHVMNVLGYLAHEFKDESLGYIIVFTEQCENPEDGGGTGKNLFGSLLSLSTSYHSIPGSQVQYNEKFLQSWNGERVLCISDAEENFKFGFLKDLSTGKAIVKKLFKDEKGFDASLLPKFIIGTNFSYEIKDGGLKRRIIHLEFTDFFTKNGGVKKYFGKKFPNDWSESDYCDYDNFICKSIQSWLRTKLELENPVLSDTGWEKQFMLNFGNIITTFIKKHWAEWKKQMYVFNTDFVKQLDDHMSDLGYAVNSNYRPKSIRINKALKEWCRKHEYEFVPDVTKKIETNNPYEAGNTGKCRTFIACNPPF